jgi:hypothetical protein
MDLRTTQIPVVLADQEHRCATSDGAISLSLNRLDPHVQADGDVYLYGIDSMADAIVKNPTLLRGHQNADTWNVELKHDAQMPVRETSTPGINDSIAATDYRQGILDRHRPREAEKHRSIVERCHSNSEAGPINQSDHCFSSTGGY